MCIRDSSYSERKVGRADFTGLDLNTADGRLYYTVAQPGSYAAQSPRYSVAIPLENDGSNAVTAESETLVRSAKGVQLRDNYGVLTLSLIHIFSIDFGAVIASRVASNLTRALSRASLSTGFVPSAMPSSMAFSSFLAVS